MVTPIIEKQLMKMSRQTTFVKLAEETIRITFKKYQKI